jgi:cysteine desulfuration protein SufE
MTQFYSCLDKQKRIIKLFSLCKTPSEKYAKLIDLGRTQAPLDEQYKIPENIVQGCQSTVYLRTYVEDGVIHFQTECDALISAGLAMILVEVYSGETAETILKCPPEYLNEIGLSAGLSPSRASGLYSIHLRMQREALKYLVKNESATT